MVDPILTCAADKERRTITFTIPQEHFDEMRAYAMLADALAVISGRKHSLVPVERWIDLGPMP